MSFKTSWGYSLEDCDELPNLLTQSEFNTLTGNKFDGDVRIYEEIKAASSSVRNFCGWHIYPAKKCKMSELVLHENGRIKQVGNDVMIQLPAKFISEVTSVKINDLSHDVFYLDVAGILYLFDVDFCAINRKTKIDIEYTAGFPEQSMAAVKEIIAHRVTHALSNSFGVASESAGGVSITYSANWINSSRASALPDDNKEVLSFYKIQGVF